MVALDARRRHTFPSERPGRRLPHWSEISQPVYFFRFDLGGAALGLSLRRGLPCLVQDRCERRSLYRGPSLLRRLLVSGADALHRRKLRVLRAREHRVGENAAAGAQKPAEWPESRCREPVECWLCALLPSARLPSPPVVIAWTPPQAVTLCPGVYANANGPLDGVCCFLWQIWREKTGARVFYTCLTRVSSTSPPPVSLAHNQNTPI